MPDHFKDVGTRIAMRLAELNLRQADLCRMANLSSNAISQYVTGKRTPDTLSLYKMAGALKVSMEWLLTGNNGQERLIEGKTKGGVEQPRENDSGIDKLNDRESEIILILRELDARDQREVYEVLKLKYELNQLNMENYCHTPEMKTVT